MKHIQRYALLFVAILVIATSCKKSVPEQTKYIPKDAMFVFDLNWKSLSEKASKGNINWDSLFRSVSNQEEDSMMREGKKKLDDFIHSGIDTTKDIFFFAKMGGSIMGGQSVSGGVVGGMKDAAQFEAYIKKQPDAGEVQKGSNYSYIKLTEGVYVGWNSDVVILAGSQNTPSRFYDSTGSSGSSGGANQQVLAALFAQKEEESVASIAEFRDLMNEKGDMLFWSNSSSALSSVPFLGMTKFADLLKDSYGAGVINFEDGKVTASFKSYSGKDLADILKKYAGPTVDMSMVNQYPSPLEGYAAFSFNPQLIKEIIKYGGFESTVNQFMDKAGYSLDDILKVFKGDFAVVFSDISYNEKEYDYNGMQFKSKSPGAKLIFNAAIADKATYDKLAAKLADQGLMEMKNGQYVPSHMDGMAFSMDGKNLIIASDSSLLQQYLAAKGNAAIPSAVADQSKGKAIAFYIDINKILEPFAADSSMGGESARAAKATFSNATATSENYNGKYIASSMELKMVNEKENSLVSLVKFFAAVSKEAVKMENRMNHGGMMDMDDMEMDSLKEMMPPPQPKSE